MAELAYVKTALCLPGEFSLLQAILVIIQLVTLLDLRKASMSQVKPPPIRTLLQHNIHVSNYLSDCTHVFVRNDKIPQ